MAQKKTAPKATEQKTDAKENTPVTEQQTAPKAPEQKADAGKNVLEPVLVDKKTKIEPIAKTTKAGIQKVVVNGRNQSLEVSPETAKIIKGFQ